MNATHKYDELKSTDYNYEVVFQGQNINLGTVIRSFVVTGSLTKDVGTQFLTAAKRLYVGAQRTNLTGAVVAPCDVYFGGLRYWAKYLDDYTLLQHANDFQNHGISGSYQNILPVDPTGDFRKLDITNLNMLALNWDFSQITASNAAGSVTSLDMSSGSVVLRDNYGWL